MSTLHVQLPDKLRAFAEAQAQANRLSGAEAYIQSLLEREALELALVDGIDSGFIDVDDAWRDRRRRELIERHQRPDGE